MQQPSLRFEGMVHGDKRILFNYHPICVSIIKELIELCSVTKSGTYNRADPTHYEHRVGVLDGLTIECHDCTWGVEVTIKTTPLKENYLAKSVKSAVLGEIYLTNDRGNSYLIPRKIWNNNLFRVLNVIVKNRLEKATLDVEWDFEYNYPSLKQRTMTKQEWHQLRCEQYESKP